MNIAQLRQQFPFLGEFTDEEVARALIAAHGVTDPRDPRYGALEQQLLGYDRTTGEKLKDAGIGLVQGALGVAETGTMVQGMLMPGVRAFDNPVVNTIRDLSSGLDQYKSPGLRAQESGAQVASDIAVRQARAEGAGLPGRILAGAEAQGASYFSHPGLAVQDAIQSAPSLLAGGAAGRVIQSGARFLGAGVKAATRAGIAGGIGASSVLQGGDVAGDTYQRLSQAAPYGYRQDGTAKGTGFLGVLQRPDGGISTEISIGVNIDGREVEIPTLVPTLTKAEVQSLLNGDQPSPAIVQKAVDHARSRMAQGLSPFANSGVDYDTAAAAAGQAGLKGGIASLALTALPGASTIERSLIRGAGGRGGLVGAVRGGAAEFASEAGEEGYGQFAGNQAVQQFDPNQDLAQGVGRAAIQGGLAAGPLGAIGGARHGAPPVAAPAPRTETGEIDLAGAPPKAAVRQRIITDQGLAQSLAAPQPEVPAYLRNPDTIPSFLRAEPETTPLAGSDVNPVQRGYPSVVDFYAEQTPDPFDTSRFPAEPSTSPGAGPSVAAPAQQPSPLTAAGATDFTTSPGAAPSRQSVDFTRDVDTGDLAIAQPGQPTVKTKPTVGNVLVALEKANTTLGKNIIRKDGQVSQSSSTAPLRAVLEAKDPLAKMRELYQDGKGARDELLDVWHKELTGQTISDFKSQPQTNSAGFVSEPLPQINAQLQAVRQGRVNGVVLGVEDAAKVDLKGLKQAKAVGPDGATAIVVGKDKKALDVAVARAKEVGLKQAMGEFKGMANPTLTSQRTAPAEGAAAVQQVDNKTGQVIGEELVTPGDVANVRPIEGTTPRLVPADQPVNDRVQHLEPKKPTLAQRKISARVDGAGAAMDGLGLSANPHKPGTAAYREWIEGHDEVKARAEAAKENPIAKKLVKVVEETKDEQLYDDSLYALYKLAARGDVTAFNYFHDNGYYNERNENGNPEKLKPAQRAEMEKLRARWEAEQGQMRGKKFAATKFRDAETSGKPLEMQALTAITEAIRAAVPDAPKIEIAENPAAVGLEHPGGKLASGVTTSDGRIILFREGITSRLEALKTAFHELFHRGVGNLVPADEYHATMDRLYQADPLVQQYAHRWGNSAEARGRKHLGMSNRNLRSLAIEEALADIAEELKTGDGLGSGRSKTVRNVIGWLANVADRLGMRELAQWLRRTSMTQAEKFIIDAVDVSGRTPPDGPPRGQKFSMKDDALAAFSARFGKTDPKTAVQETQDALVALRNQATDYRTMAQNAMTRGKVEIAQGLLDRARGFEQQLETLEDDLKVAKIATAASASGQNAVKFRADDKSPVKPLAEGARSLAATLKAQAKGEEISRSLLNMLTLRQIDEQYGHKLPALRDWVSTVMERSSNASKLAAEADRVALRWQQDVPKAEMKPLAEILLRASNAELQLDNNSPKYLSTLSDAERKEHQALRAKLEALSPAAKQARKEALAVLNRQWEYTHNALKKFITLTVSDPLLRAERLRSLDNEFGRNHGDYFPLSRFGDRVVIARGAAKDGRDVVTFHETAKGVEDEVRRLKDSGVNPGKIIVTMSTEYDPKNVPGTGFVRELHAMIDSVADGEEARQLHQTLQQLYLKSLPEMSGAKHMVRRENIEGYSQDALRAFADAVTRGSRYASHLEYGPAVHAAMEAAETQSRSSDRRTAAVVIGRKEGSQPVVKVVGTGTERLRAVEKMAEDGYAVEFFSAHPETVAERLAGALENASPEELANYLREVRAVVKKSSEGVEDLRAAKELYNYMVRAQKATNMLDSKSVVEKGVDLAGQVGYAWYLGFSPAFWAMNILQNPMVGIPHLGGKYGVTKSSAEWMRAAKWFATVRVGKRLAKDTEPFSVEWLREQVNSGELKGINKNELDMLQRLEDRQVLDFTQAMDLSRIGSATNSKWYKAMRLAAAGAHHTEVFNRVSFALAAYRLAMKSRSDMTHEEAMRAAEHDVASAHFDYSYANKPLWMGKTTPAMRLVFMFQQYRQHMLYWWANTIKDAIKGLTPEERSQARKAALLMGTTQLLFAGTMGLPFIGAVSTLANLLGGGDDGEEPFDFERWIREAAVGMTGSEEGADVVTKGIFAALGADISKRIGQADLLPFLSAGSARFERDTDDKVRAYLFDLLGPLGSIAVNAARATTAFSEGDYLGGLALATPKAVGDILRAYQQATEGLKDKRGQQLAAEEAFDGWDAAFQLAGVTPTSVSNVKQARGAVLDIQNEFRDQSRRLTGAFIQAWTHGDQEGMAEALDDIRAYNANIAKGRIRDPKLLITPDRIRSAIVDRQRRAMLLALTGGLADTRQQLLIATRMSGLYDLGGRDFRLDGSGLPSLAVEPSEQ